VPIEEFEGTQEQVPEPGDTARMTFFSDAAVAFSLTLLMLPVADYVRESPGKTWGQLFLDNPEIVESLASFVIVVVCWRYHHLLFEQIRDYDRLTLWLNFTWLFLIISIPINTLAVLPVEETLQGNDRIFLDTFFFRGREDIPSVNYAVLWGCIALSFLMLTLIARNALPPDRHLSKSDPRRQLDPNMYLRIFVICAVTAIVSLASPFAGDIVLYLGIAVNVIVSRRLRSSQGQPA
jgi:uncharacterized membrane protein